MIASHFYMHAAQIREVIITSMSLYCTKNNIPWDREKFLERTETDLDALSKEALFHGAEEFPLC